MKLTFLGHAAIKIDDESFHALIDPFLSNNPQYVHNPDDTLDITHIFITHGHADHVGDALSIAKRCHATIVANAELCSLFAQKDPTLRLHPMHIGGSHTFPFGRVKMTPAVHGSSYRDEDGVHDGGNPGGFLIDIAGTTIYHAGDTGLTYDMTLLAQEHIDVAFLPIGGNYTMDIPDAIRVCGFLKPRLVVPIHYNTFPLIQADPLAFQSALPAGQVIVLSPGESLQL
jgi:L-ascorbate metabolism protein UlaG (beta-lactamase superfamily)